ncbi:hypothetical protein [Streptomyces sp. NK15101]|uniref:hypothetical protein n=1 Tax=Streptomyces sp. NK15101 TaxID=2873261 RepID=UPI001CEC9707|nr:hypothetical protein [Streptomyces sp. NK15101]
MSPARATTPPRATTPHSTELRAYTGSVRAEAEELRQTVACSEARLDLVVASRTAFRTDLDTEEAESHRTLADRYANFVEQSLYGIARKAVREKHGDLPPDKTARVVAALCGELFGRADVSERRVRRVLGIRADHEPAQTVQRVVTRARGIVAESVRMKTRGSWEFDRIPGAPLDEGRQQPWARCDR